MTGLAPVRVGDVIHIAEGDYSYGLGCLTLHITEVHGLGPLCQRGRRPRRAPDR